MTQDERDSIMRAIAWLMVLEAKTEHEPKLAHYVRCTRDELRRISAKPVQEGQTNES